MGYPWLLRMTVVIVTGALAILTVFAVQLEGRRDKRRAVSMVDGEAVRAAAGRQGDSVRAALGWSPRR